MTRVDRLNQPTVYKAVRLAPPHSATTLKYCKRVKTPENLVSDLQCFPKT